MQFIGEIICHICTTSNVLNTVMYIYAFEQNLCAANRLKSCIFVKIFFFPPQCTYLFILLLFITITVYTINECHIDSMKQFNLFYKILIQTHIRVY